MEDTGIKEPSRANRKPPLASSRKAQLDFEQMVREYQPYVHRLVHRLLGWSGDVEDVVQDVFVTVLEKLETFRGQSSLKTWLTTITINRCRRHQRRQWLRMKWFHQAQTKSIDEYENAPESAMENREQSELLRQALQRLPQGLREVLILRYLQQQSIQEVSEILKLSINIVNVRLHRARKRLGEILNATSKN